MAPARQVCASAAALCLLLLVPCRAAKAPEVAAARAAARSPIQTLDARIATLRNESAARHLKTAAEIAFERTKRTKMARNTVCAFSIYQAVNFLARAAAQIHAMTTNCPKVIPGEIGYLTAEKACLVQSSSLVTSMSQIITGLSIAADRCQDSITNVDALCTAGISGLFTPLSQYIAASTVASATCAAQVAGLPKDIELGRRLAEERELQSPTQPPYAVPKAWDMAPEDRRWQLGECAIDASSAVMAVGQIAIGLNAATQSCPTLIGPKIQEDVSTGVCTLDIGFTWFSLIRTILFVALAVEHCAPGRQTDALCVAACSSLLSSSFGVVASSAGIYLNCQIGLPVRSILLGIDPIVTSGLKKTDVTVDGTSDAEAVEDGPVERRRLTKEEVLDDLFKAAGYSRRLSKHELIDELAKESKFDNYEDLWLSMGYNLSDTNASWMHDDPAGAEVIRRGEELIKELQTVREEPAEELRELGPEASPPSRVPDALVDPSDDEGTLRCSQRGIAYSMDLAGHPVTLEAGVAACQSRCARTPGCVRFSYWPPDRHCRVHGILADPISGQTHWISGPAGCREEQISNSTRRTMRRKLECFHPHAAYELGKVKIGVPAQADSVEECQTRCQQLQGCAFFTFSEMDGLCSFSDKSAVKLQPVMFSIAGPRHCADAAQALTGLADSSARPREAREAARLGAVSGRFGAAAALAGAISALAVVGLLVRAASATRQAYSRIAPGAASVAAGP